MGCGLNNIAIESGLYLAGSAMDAAWISLCAALAMQLTNAVCDSPITEDVQVCSWLRSLLAGPEISDRISL